MKSFANTLTTIGALAATAAAVDPIVVKEQEFINSNNNDRFVILGVDYQPGGQGAYGPSNTQDPLSNGTRCLRDAALMQNLGVNTIRSYNVDPSLNHDECASIFNSVGIYMILDVNSPLSGEYIDRSDPGSTYTETYVENVFRRIEAFKGYPNTLGFFAGNEIINDMNTGKANPPYIRALQRDMKQYIAQNADRPIPVGYSAADVRDFLEDTWAYLQCDNSDGEGDDMSSSDFFGLNSYSWCGESTFQEAGYSDLVSIFSNTTIPVFFSEYGCNEVTPRIFDEVQALYGPQMTVMSGGLIYEWTQESSNYGIVNTYENGSAELLGDYDNLAGQYAKVNLTLLETSNDTATNLQAPKCSAGLISSDGFATDFDIPSQPDGVSDLISNGVTGVSAGSIVSVTATQVKAPVYATNGGKISGLAITTTEGANRPGNGGGLSTGAPQSSSGSDSDSDSDSTSSADGSDSTSSPTSSSGNDDDSESPSATTSEGAESASTETGAASNLLAANGAVLGAAVGLAAFVL